MLLYWNKIIVLGESAVLGKSVSLSESTTLSECSISSECSIPSESPGRLEQSSSTGGRSAPYNYTTHVERSAHVLVLEKGFA